MFLIGAFLLVNSNEGMIIQARPDLENELAFNQLEEPAASQKGAEPVQLGDDIMSGAGKEVEANDKVCPDPQMFLEKLIGVEKLITVEVVEVDVKY